MKRIVYFASILFLASSIISCHKEIQNTEDNSTSKVGVTVNVVADGNLVSDDATKTSAVVDGTTTKFKWTEGDAITFYEYVDDELNEYKGSEPAVITDGYSATFTVNLTKEDPSGRNYIYTACYPKGAFSSSGTHDRYQIPSTQALTAAGNFDPAADIMFGKAEPRISRVADDTELDLSFKRLGTVVKLTLDGITSGEKINTVSITAPKNIAGYCDIDFMTGVVGELAYSSWAKTINLNAGGLTSSGNDVVWFRCIEGTWEAGKNFTIVIDTDKAGYTKDITIPEGGLEFAAGGLTKLTIGSLGNYREEKVTETYNKVTAEPDDWTGEYLLVYENEGKAYIWTGVDETSCYAEETISDNKISSVPTGAVTLTVAAMEGGYSIQINGGTNDGKYIGRSSYDNGLQFGDEAMVNTLEIAENSAKISGSGASGDSHVTIRYNSASDQKRFRYYKSGQQSVQLYKLDDGKTDPNITTQNKSINTNGSQDVSEMFVTNSDGAITYSVEDGNLDPNTHIFTTEQAGKYTVTFKQEATDTYRAATKTANITVTEPEWTLQSIAITTEPSKTVYEAGERFNPSGMVVEGTFKDETNVVKSWAVINYEYPSEVLTERTTSVQISYTYKTVTKTANQSITVNAATTTWNLQSIAITTPPTKTEYTQGETLDLTGMVVTATYTDAAGVKADKQEEVSSWTSDPENGATLSTVGDVTVTVSFTDGDTKTATQTVKEESAATPKELTLTFEQWNNTQYSTDETTFILDNITVGYINAMKNGSNGTPTGWAKNQVIQTKSGGYIYNKTSLGKITSIKFSIVTNTNSFTLNYGSTAECTSYIESSKATSGTESVTYTKYENKKETSGQTTTANTYTFDLSDTDAEYFNFACGSKAVYIYKIEISYVK